MNRKGQTTVEFVLGSSLLFIAITGAGWVLKASWDRAQCAYLVFENTHAKVTGRSVSQSPIRIRFSENPQFVEGSGRCGFFHESVQIRKLVNP
jgi:hypothetical protein